MSTKSSLFLPNHADGPWRVMPKVLLHEHLDGGLRVGTLLDLARRCGMDLPASSEEGLASWMADNAHAGSLERYLQGFDMTVQAMASLEACERVAFEAAEDALAEHCVWAEFRMAPSLFEAHGLPMALALEALLAGLARSALPCGFIVCAMRTDPPELTKAVAAMAARYRDRGVVGFDLAGAEKGHPPSDHPAALSIALEAGLGLTLHAGEADGGHRVIEAIRLGARRIGHGIRVMDQAPWTAEAKDAGVHFEVCPTSNVHTGASKNFKSHPLPAMWAAGLSASVSTDNTLISGIRLSQELARVHHELGVSKAQLQQSMLMALDASFAPQDTRTKAMATLQSSSQAPFSSSNPTIQP